MGARTTLNDASPAIIVAPNSSAAAQTFGKATACVRQTKLTHRSALEVQRLYGVRLFIRPIKCVAACGGAWRTNAQRVTFINHCKQTRNGS